MSRERKIVLMAVAFVLAVVLCLSITSIAIADEVTAAAISKTLQMPIGTTTPTASFKFAVTGVSVNGDEDTKPPAVGGSFTIDFDALDTGIISGDVKTVVKESPSIFADTTFTSAGVYEYTVTETAGTWSTFRETMVYSQASYTLKVYVKDDGVAPNVIYIDNITATKTHNDAGDEVSAKVDPTPGDSEMVFVNTFIKQGTGTEPDPDDSSLIIKKTVSGDYASVTTPFSFSVMVTAPSLVSGSPTYHAYIMPAGTTQITFTSGVAETVQLKANEYIMFIDLHVGTSFTVTETGVAGYEPTAEVLLTAGGGTVTGTAGNDLTIPGGNMPDVLRVGEKNMSSNIASFNNDLDTPPDSGIFIEYLPYIGIFTLCIGGLVAYVAMKQRERRVQA